MAVWNRNINNFIISVCYVRSTNWQPVMFTITPEIYRAGLPIGSRVRRHRSAHLSWSVDRRIPLLSLPLLTVHFRFLYVASRGLSRSETEVSLVWTSLVWVALRIDPKAVLVERGVEVHLADVIVVVVVTPRGGCTAREMRELYMPSRSNAFRRQRHY